MLLRQEVTQSHAEDLQDLLHGMHPGKKVLLFNHSSRATLVDSCFKEYN